MTMISGPQMVCPACEETVSIPGPCDDCQAEFDQIGKEMDRLERAGHNYHCAARIIWGDGQCECGNVFWHTTTGEELPIVE